MFSCEIWKNFKNISGGCLSIPLRWLRQNCKYIIKRNQCKKVNVWSIASWCIHSKIMIVNVGSKNMLAHLLLVFEHGFIQKCFGSFKFFYPIFFPLNFTRYLFSEIFSRYLLQFFYSWETLRDECWILK